MGRDSVKVEEQQKHVTLYPPTLLLCPTKQRQVKGISLIHHSWVKQPWIIIFPHANMQMQSCMASRDEPKVSWDHFSKQNHDLLLYACDARDVARVHAFRFNQGCDPLVPTLEPLCTMVWDMVTLYPTSCCLIKLPSYLYWVFFLVTIPSLVWNFCLTCQLLMLELMYKCWIYNILQCPLLYINHH